jgi:asparagine synthase (glutamine-hydrolysing)
MMLGYLYRPSRSLQKDMWLESYYLSSFRKCYDDLETMLNPETLAGSGGQEAIKSFLHPYFKSNARRNFIKKLMNINIRMKEANLILTKVDKMTAAHGILPLSPLFTKRMIESSMRCPPVYKLRGNIG